MHGLHETGVITGLSPEFVLQPCTCPLCVLKALPGACRYSERNQISFDGYYIFDPDTASKGRLYASLWQGEAHNFRH